MSKRKQKGYATELALGWYAYVQTPSGIWAPLSGCYMSKDTAEQELKGLGYAVVERQDSFTE